jgi:hypothetical protein
MKLIGFVSRARGMAVYVDDIPNVISMGVSSKYYRMIHVTIGEQTVLKVHVEEAMSLRDLLDKAIIEPEVNDG